jgi:glycogen debranching enzyme
VAVRDPDFSETRMWRGPVWVNTNWLVAQGLRRQGLIDKAERLERATLELVAAQGPNEYFRPDTGVKPPRATTVFGWSAALTVDLAVAHS